MNKLHFKDRFYRFYSPYVFKLKRAWAKFLAWNWSLDKKQTNELINYCWDRFLTRMFYREVPFYSGKVFDFSNVKRTSDTIFVLGCGASIENISDDEWKIIAQHDSIGVNYFYSHPFRPTFHMVELGKSPKSMDCLNKYLLTPLNRSKEQVFVQLRHLLNRDVVDLNDSNGNLHLYSPSVPKSTSTQLMKKLVKHWYDKRGTLIHHASNLDCTIHFAYQAGYKNIYLLGVDLNNNQYFWDVSQAPSQALIDVREATADDYRLCNFNPAPNVNHATADKGKTSQVNSLTILEYLNIVNDEIFKPANVRFATCSPKSLLREYFPYQELKEIGNEGS